MTSARSRLDAVRSRELTAAEINDTAISLAGELLQLTHQLADQQEAERNRKLARLMDDRPGQLFSTLLTDRVPRLKTGRDVVHQAIGVLDQCGVPQSLGALDRLQLRALKPLGPVLPALLGPAIRHRIRSESAAFLIPGEVGKVGPAVAALKGPGIRVNVNQLGEEVLGHHALGESLQQLGCIREQALAILGSIGDLFRSLLAQQGPVVAETEPPDDQQNKQGSTQDHLRGLTINTKMVVAPAYFPVPTIQFAPLQSSRNP